MRRIALGSLALLTLACRERDEKRLERLQLAQHIAVLRVIKWEQDSASSPSASDSLRRARLQLQLARRELALFLNGR